MRFCDSKVLRKGSFFLSLRGLDSTFYENSVTNIVSEELPPTGGVPRQGDAIKRNSAYTSSGESRATEGRDRQRMMRIV